MTGASEMTEVSPPIFMAAVQAATRAPSLHNAQPWRFRLREGCIEVYTDPSRQLKVADPTGWAVRVACGAAVFNARLALAVAHLPAEVRLRPEPARPELLARLHAGPPRPPSPQEVALHAAIPRRHSNRQPFAAQLVPPDARQRLVQSARDEGAWLELLIGRGPLAALAEIVRAADNTLNRRPEYRAELSDWVRGDDDVEGVPRRAGGPSPEPYDLLAMRNFGGDRRPAGRSYEPDPLVAVLGTVGDSPYDQLVAGQALQRVLLTATDAGLAASMLSQPIEVAAAREQLRLGLGRFGTPQMVMRIGYGQPGYPTARRPLTDVIDDS